MNSKKRLRLWKKLESLFVAKLQNIITNLFFDPLPTNILSMGGFLPCPWYKSGMCTSPRLREPSTLVVNPERCLGKHEDYRSCRYFVDVEKQEEKEKSLTRFTQPTPAIAQQLKPYPPIHLLHTKPSSTCPYFKVYEYAGNYLAYCNVLERLLTRSEVKNCEKLWKNCPFYKLGRSCTGE